jgi:hypothetical protein
MFTLRPPFQRVWAYPAKPAKVQLTKIWFGLADHRGPPANLTAESIGHDEIAVVSRLTVGPKRWPLVCSLLRRAVAIGEMIT